MVRTSFIRYTHRAQILNKTTSTNDTGQKMPVWSVIETDMPCFATPASMRASIRVTPTAEQGDFLTFYVPEAANITYGSRVRGIKRRDKIIFAGPYEVQDIKPMVGFSGSVEYQEITLKKVIE